MTNVHLQPFTKTCKRKLNLSRTHTNSPTNMWIMCSDSRTVDNSQAFSTTYPRGSTRVCRIETCKDHHGKKLSQMTNVHLQPFTKTCKRKLNLSRTHTNSPQTCGFICSDSRTVDNSQAFSKRLPCVGSTSAEWKLVSASSWQKTQSWWCTYKFPFGKDPSTRKGVNLVENAHKFSTKHVFMSSWSSMTVG